MAELDDFKVAFDRVKTEVSETSDQVKKLRDKIADLETQIGDTTALKAAIVEATADATAIADKLDSLQDHEPVPQQ